MPQLKFAWWLMKFIIGWITLIMLMTMISKKWMSTKNLSSSIPSTQKTSMKLWYWN